ncbi:ABC transporter ATP-binding protein [Clostridium sp. 19966]|uniref:ABC transporter ATP-binding protein n=1 Tax=Clostridium sp. 19966 TaxID=2768166 RepID=UPI0028E09376|nr:ABC transporter ATP-binding protein [Clostridium sp. 19966]MDT8715765.1 ABC transporter ATP-binding protein [Clostridium sp. 19966]
MIEIKNVSKSFPGKEAIKNINITINDGSILGLVGPNGAGKSTLLRTMVDIYEPDTGEILINKENIKDNTAIKEIIGYVGDRNDFFNDCKIKEILKYYSLSYPNFDKDRFNKINSIFKIPLNKKISKLSKGNATRVHLMMAFSQNPKIMILDEPTSGLDPIIKRKFLNLLMEDVAERGTTVIISSHNLPDLESICDHIVFLNEGEIIKDNSLDNLKLSMKKIQIIFKEEAPEDFEKWPEFLRVEKIGRSYNVITKDYNDSLKEKLEEQGVLFIEELNLSLEDMLIYSVED